MTDKKQIDPDQMARDLRFIATMLRWALEDGGQVQTNVHICEANKTAKTYLALETEGSK